LIKEHLDKDLTFTPTIISSRAKESSDDDTGGSDVFTRLSSSRQYIQDVLGQIKTEMEMSECTFRPTLPQKEFAR